MLRLFLVLLVFRLLFFPMCAHSAQFCENLYWLDGDISLTCQQNELMKIVLTTNVGYVDVSIIKVQENNQCTLTPASVYNGNDTECFYETLSDRFYFNSNSEYIIFNTLCSQGPCDITISVEVLTGCPYCVQGCVGSGLDHQIHVGADIYHYTTNLISKECSSDTRTMWEDDGCYIPPSPTPSPFPSPSPSPSPAPESKPKKGRIVFFSVVGLVIIFIIIIAIVGCYCFFKKRREGQLSYAPVN